MILKGIRRFAQVEYNCLSEESYDSLLDYLWKLDWVTVIVNRDCIWAEFEYNSKEELDGSLEYLIGYDEDDNLVVNNEVIECSGASMRAWGEEEEYILNNEDSATFRRTYVENRV